MGTPYLLLRGDVVIDEGHALVGALPTHAGDPSHRHLAGLDGGLGAITAQLGLLLPPGTGAVVTNNPGGAVPTPCPPRPLPQGPPTSFSVTNSASSPTRSPAWGISLSMRGMKVAWHLRCLRASEASASSTLASMGFLTVQGKGEGAQRCPGGAGPAAASTPGTH